MRWVVTVLGAALVFGLAPSVPARAETATTATDSSQLAQSPDPSAADAADTWQKLKADATFSQEFSWDVPDLNKDVVKAYSRYVSVRTDGTFVADIPAKLFFSDPKGAWATVNSVNQSNRVVLRQLALLHQQGQKVELNSYVYGQPLPMGEHAHFTPLWWGMTFTFDAVATKAIDRALTLVGAGLKVVESLKSLGVVMTPAVSAIVSAVVTGLKMAITATRKCMTENGLVVKSLWLPIPWCEKPTEPFVAALPYSVITGKTTNSAVEGKPGTATATAAASGSQPANGRPAGGDHRADAPTPSGQTSHASTGKSTNHRGMPATDARPLADTGH